jgi:hypothetical protein
MPILDPAQRSSFFSVGLCTVYQLRGAQQTVNKRSRPPQDSRLTPGENAVAHCFRVKPPLQEDNGAIPGGVLSSNIPPGRQWGRGRGSRPK